MEHYHIWRMSGTCTAWFFNRGWNILGPPRAVRQNQFETRKEARALIAQVEPDPRYSRRYMVLRCSDIYYCPIIRSGYSL